MSNFSSLACLEHTFLVRSGQTEDGYSDNRANSVQLGWDLTELGNTVKDRNYLPVRVVTAVVETSHPVYILYKDILNRYFDIITENIIAENKNVNPELRKLNSPQSKAVDIVAEDHGVAEPVEEVVHGQDGGPMVG